MHTCLALSAMGLSLFGLLVLRDDVAEVLPGFSCRPIQLSWFDSIQMATLKEPDCKRAKLESPD